MKLLWITVVVVSNYVPCWTQQTTTSSSEVTTQKTVVVVEDNDPAVRIRQHWIDSDRALRSGMVKLIKGAMPVVLREVYSKNVSTECLTGLLQVTSALRKGKLWPFQMIDACGKLPEGFLKGSLTLLGDYKECLSIDIAEKKVKVRGQYCNVEISPPIPKWRPFMSIHVIPKEFINISEPDSLVTHITGFIHNLYVTTIKIGVCVPSACSLHDLQQLVQIVPEKSGIPWKFDVSHCETKHDTVFTSAQIGIVYTLGFITILVICGTLIDVIWTEEKAPKTTTIQLLRSFSFPGNARKLASYGCQDEQLHFVYGMMFFTLFWIIISNTIMYVNYDVVSNLLEAFSIIRHLAYEVLLSRVYPIHTFYYLIGFICAYKLLNAKDSEFCLWKYLLRRFWRYTPAYIFTIMLLMLSPLWGSGPSWADHMNSIYTNCHNNWWKNILYINNFFPVETACLDHTWVFAVDAQLHIIGIFIFIPLLRHPKIGLMVNFMLMGASLLTIALTNVYYDLPPNEMMSFLVTRDRNFYASHTYVRVYAHLVPYCTGIATAYLMSQKPKFQMSRSTSWIIGIITVTAALATLTSPHEWNLGIIPAPLVGAVYATLGKLAWSLLLSWITVACMTGRGGAMRDVLSWSPFPFFSRLLFIGYIIHPVIMQAIMGYKKSHLYIEDIEILYIVVSHVGATYLLSYICYMGFEAPILSLTDYLTKKVRSRPFNSNVNYPGNSCVVAMSEKPVRYKDTKLNNEPTRTKF